MRYINYDLLKQVYIKVLIKIIFNNFLTTIGLIEYLVLTFTSSFEVLSLDKRFMLVDIYGVGVTMAVKTSTPSRFPCQGT